MPKAAILKTSLDFLYYSGASQVLRNIFGGIGAIFMLHHVKPGGGLQTGFAPNAELEVTPEFLDQVIGLAKARRFNLVSLEEAVNRLTGEERTDRPFAVFTLDDGYRDNLIHARAVFRKHGCPFTIFVAPSINDGTCELWWRGLEAVIAGAAHVEAEIDGQKITLATISDAQKQVAWQRLYWPVRQMDQVRQRDWIGEFCVRHGVNGAAMCRAQAMTWDELRMIAADPLCTIGAHTVHHYAIGQLPKDAARRELVQSRERIEEELGRRPQFFAYPYGDPASAGQRDFELAKEAGYRAALTTRKGLIFSGHKDHLLSLPRVSLSGDFQKLRYVDVLLSGTAFALWNGFRRVNIA